MNCRMPPLARPLWLCALTLGLCAAAMAALPLLWPFGLAFLFSCLLEPFVRFAAKGFLHLPRRTAAGLGMIWLFGLAGMLAAFLLSWLIRELADFLRALPQLVQWANDAALPSLLAHLPEMPKEAAAALGENALRWAASLSGWITGGAWRTAVSLPHGLLSVAVMISATYAFTAERERIAAGFRRALPAPLMERARLIGSGLGHALLGQMRSQLMLSLVVMFFLMLTLGLSGMRYGVIAGMLIGMADALPVLGAGLFLLPWSLISFLSGQTGTGVMLLCLYAGTLLLRQILEPRLLSRSLGLEPPAAMAAMYIGFRLMGFVGLLAGPVLLQLLRAVLEADRAVRSRK